MRLFENRWIQAGAIKILVAFPLLLLLFFVCGRRFENCMLIVNLLIAFFQELSSAQFAITFAKSYAFAHPFTKLTELFAKPLQRRSEEPTLIEIANETWQ